MLKSQFDPAVFSAMQDGKPYSAYRKTIPAKIHVVVLDPFRGEPMGLILTGRPGDEDTIVKLYSVQEDVFFKRMNKRHFQQGNLVSHEIKNEEEPVKILEQMDDEEVVKTINSKFYTLANVLQKTESEAFLFRLLNAARENEKSEKIINAIQTRLAEVQAIKTSEVKDE